MNNKYEHIIWDWNGTLLDDVNYCVNIINNVLSKRKLKVISSYEYKEIFTFPVKNYYERLGLLNFGETFEELSVEFIQLYERDKLKCNLFIESKEILDYFLNYGINQSILSAYKFDTLKEIISHFGLNKYFSNIVGMDNIYAFGKIQIGERLVEKINCNKDKIVLIGDTIHDCEVANHLGIDSILVSHGHQKIVKNRECKSICVNSLLEIKNIVRINENSKTTMSEKW